MSNKQDNRKYSDATDGIDCTDCVVRLADLRRRADEASTAYFDALHNHLTHQISSRRDGATHSTTNRTKLQGESESDLHPALAPRKLIKKFSSRPSSGSKQHDIRPLRISAITATPSSSSSAMPSAKTSGEPGHPRSPIWDGARQHYRCPDTPPRAQVHTASDNHDSSNSVSQKQNVGEAATHMQCTDSALWDDVEE